MKQSIAEEMYELQEMRRKVRALEGELQRRSDAATPLMPDDERKMIELQSRADETYRAIGRFAAAPMPMERPAEYRRRLLQGLLEYSPRLAGADVARLDDAVLDRFEPMIYQDALANAPAHGCRADEIRPIAKRENGHDTIVFAGGENAHFVKTFARPARRAVFKSPGEYAAMERDANLALVEQVITAAHRQTVQAPRASF